MSIQLEEMNTEDLQAEQARMRTILDQIERELLRRRLGGKSGTFADLQGWLKHLPSCTEEEIEAVKIRVPDKLLRLMDGLEDDEPVKENE